MADKLRCENPHSVHRPLGPYSHTVVVPPGAGLLFIAGQIGMRSDGATDSTIGAQADQAFANVVALLEAHELDVTSVIKLTVFIVAGSDAEAVKKARLTHFGSHEPASTTLFVSQLLRADWLIEVEAIAVGPAGGTA